MIGCAQPQPDDSVGRAGRGFDLDECHSDVGESIGHRLMLIAKSRAEPLDEAAHRVDRQRSRHQVDWVGGEVNGRELVEAHHVVGDHNLSRNRGEPRSGVFEGLGGLSDGVGVRFVEVGLVGFIRHGR